MKRIAGFIATLFAIFSIAAVLNACNSGSGSSAEAPPDLSAAAGDARVTLTFTQAPGVEYWLFYAPVAGVTTSNWASLNGRAITRISSPYTLSGLVNGTTYSFTINGRKDGGPGGPGSPTQTAIPRLAGAVWSVGTPLGTTSLNAVATGVLTTNSVANNTTVTVGAGGVIFSAIGGEKTTARTNPVGVTDLNGVAYGSLGYVAVGAAGTILFSADAITWAAQTSNTTNNLNAVISNAAGGYLAVGAGGTLLTSADGKTWVVGTSGTTNELYGLSYLLGQYTAVGAAGTLITSVDSTTWKTITIDTTNALRHVTVGSAIPAGATAAVTLWVAVGDAGTLFTSADAVTWTKQTPISAATFNGVSFGGQFVAVGSGGAIYTSTTGITWAPQSSGTTSDLKAITHNSLGYTAVGGAGANLFSF
jgi:hypothetical protein